MTNLFILCLVSLCFQFHNVVSQDTKDGTEAESIKPVPENETKLYNSEANKYLNLTDDILEVNNDTATYDYSDINCTDCINEDNVGGDVDHDNIDLENSGEYMNFTLSDSVRDAKGKDEHIKICNDNYNEIMQLNGETIELSYYEGIDFQNVWIEKCKTYAKVDTEFNTSLTLGYPEIFIYSVKWPAIPESSMVEKVFMKNVTPIGVFGGCSKLHSLDLQALDLTMVSSEWLSNCTQLSTVELRDVTVSQLRIILDSAPRVKEVIINSLTEVSEISFHPIFPSARGAHLWITDFEISNYNTADINPEVDNTNFLQMSESLMKQLSSLPRLERLKVYSFDDFDFCAVVNISTLTFESLRILQLYETSTRRLCFKELRKIPKLTTLELAQHKLDTFEFEELFSIPSAVISVDLELAIIPKINFTRNTYLALTAGSSKSNITLNIERTIDCDCEISLWLARAIMNGVLSFILPPGLSCHDGTLLENQRCDYLNCERTSCESECLCCLDYPETFFGDCRNANISSFPHNLINFDNLTTLLVPNNKLTTLPSYLPRNLTWLDLSGNDLLRRSGEMELQTLFEIPERHMLLNGNSIICSCDSQALIAQLQEHKDQIDDYENLFCSGDKTSISEVDVQGLCAFRNRQKNIIVSVSVLLLLALSVVLFGSSFYYRRSIKIFLYARGWCLFCIKEEAMDADRRYDVFLSFCHEDEKIVTEELLPVLDREYSVCVHYRDWYPGVMIPEQITKSIEQSRRTLVVVSRSFVKSLWGLLEFRTAHVTGLMEGRARVVMVVLDDVLEDEGFEGELRAYVRLNTYVKWGDPWFWDKLRFALPHHPAPIPTVSQSQPVINNSGNHHLEMLEMYDVEHPD